MDKKEKLDKATKPDLAAVSITRLAFSMYRCNLTNLVFFCFSSDGDVNCCDPSHLSCYSFAFRLGLGACKTIWSLIFSTPLDEELIWIFQCLFLRPSVSLSLLFVCDYSSKGEKKEKTTGKSEEETYHRNQVAGSRDIAVAPTHTHSDPLVFVFFFFSQGKKNKQTKRRSLGPIKWKRARKKDLNNL